MFPLAFIAGWLQGHWWGFISRNYVVWPTVFLMNVFIALKGSHFWFLLHKCVSKDQPKVFQYRLHIDSIFKLQACLTRAGCLLVRLVPMLEENKQNGKKGFFFFFQTGQWAALSSFKVRKNGILVEKGRFPAQDWYKLLTVTCSCCPYLYFGSAIMLVTYFSKF